MKTQKLEQWLDAKSWLGWPRWVWVGVALVIGSLINIYIGRAL